MASRKLRTASIRNSSVGCRTSVSGQSWHCWSRRCWTCAPDGSGGPRDADRTGPLGNAQRYMRYQWIIRLLGNPLVISDEVMEPFAREVLERAAADGEPLSLILDQSKMSDRHQVLMLALRWGERALPLAWRGEETGGRIGFDTQKALLDAVAPWLPGQAK